MQRLQVKQLLFAGVRKQPESEKQEARSEKETARPEGRCQVSDVRCRETAPPKKLNPEYHVSVF